MYDFKDYSSFENYVFDQIDRHVFPVGTVCSLPVLTRQNGRIFKAVFVYENNPTPEQTIPRPFAWTLLPTDRAGDFLFSHCSTYDFMSTKDFPISSHVSAYLANSSFSAVTLGIYTQEARTLLKEIELFAFETSPSQFQKELISRFKELFLLVCPQGLYAFYDTIAPDFFEWIELVLIAKSSVATQIESLELLPLLEQISQKLDSTEIISETASELLNELDKLKEYDCERITSGMERDVILIIDHLNKSLSSLDKKHRSADFASALRLLEGTRQDLIDLLYRQGVDPFVVEGGSVDIGRQKIIQTISTDKSELDRTVAQRLSSGWERKGVVVRPELVKAYVYDRSRTETGSQVESSKELLADE